MSGGVMAARGGRPRREVRLTALAVFAAVGTGVLVGVGLWMVAPAVVVAVSAVCVGILDWRKSIYGLLLFLPFVGVFSTLLYPQTAPAVLAKDALFVAPAYLGFGLAWLRTRERMSFDGPPVVLIALLVGLVCVQAFNPALPSLLVGLVGAKIWLFYIPLIYLGYHFVSDAEDVRRLLRLLSLVAVVPATLGIIEGVLLYTGHQSLVYSWYGGAAETVTQGYAELRIGGVDLLRVPSTFPFVAQYYVYVCSMIAVAFAWWRIEPDQVARRIAGAVLLLLVAAVFLSGARGAFVFVPILLVLILVLEPSSGRLTAWVAGAGAAGLALAIVVVGLSLGALIPHLEQNASDQFQTLFVTGFHEATKITTLGLGTGVDSSGARYVADVDILRSGIGGTWEESWWIKGLLELGVAGMLVLFALLGTLLWRLLKGHYADRSGPLAPASAALIALLIWAVIYNVKAQYLDLDPMNVYFWLFAGIVFKIHALGRTAATGEESSGTSAALGSAGDESP